MNDKKFLINAHVMETARSVANAIVKHVVARPVALYGVPRGGIPAAYAVAAQLHKLGVDCEIVESPQACHVVIDDVIDSGATMKKYSSQYDKLFFALFNKPVHWLVFPWENSGLKQEDTSADDIPIRLLQYIGEDIERGGLLETPKRFLKAWDHYTSGYGQDPSEILKVFEDGAENYDEMVLIRDIPIYSHCEHHMAPFFGVAHIAYIPSNRIVGLSKLSRLADIFSRRLQVQERLTNQIADAIEEHLKPQGVAVVINCRHMCMEARGIQRQGASTITSAMRGAFRDQQATRSEFMELIK